METKKFNEFISKLEEKRLNVNHESLILTNTIEHISGAAINRTCSNTVTSCNGSSNRNCTNYNSQGCEGTSNRGWGGCSNTEVK